MVQNGPSPPTPPMPNPDWPVLEKAFESTVSQAGGRLQSVPLIAIEPRWQVRLKCQVPLCEYYGACKVCPPNIPGIEAFRSALEGFSRAYLVIWQEEVKNLETYRYDFSAELKLADLVSALERIAYQHGFWSAMGLTVGGCKLCPQCPPADEPCRHPYKARPSPEGFGIDITTIARRAGVAIEWPPQKTVTFLGLLLV